MAKTIQTDCPGPNEVTFDRILSTRVGFVLLKIALGQIIPQLVSSGTAARGPHTCWEDTWNDNPIFKCGDWEIIIFNDCGDWDYVDGGKTPEGRVFGYENVNRCETLDEDHEPQELLTSEEEDAMETAFKKAKR